MLSHWWSLLPVAVFALFYLLFVRVIRGLEARRRRERERLFSALREKIRAGSPLHELICSELPGTAVCVLEAREHHAMRIAAKGGAAGDAEARAVLEEMEIAMPDLAREMGRHGMLYARIESLVENTKAGRANGHAGGHADRTGGGTEFGAYILRLPEKERFALAIVRDPRRLPDGDQLSRFVEFLEHHGKDGSDSHSPNMAAGAESESEFRDEKLNRLERDNQRLRAELSARDNSLARIAHDIRLPLSGLLLNHELLEKKIAPGAAPGMVSGDETRRSLSLMKNQLRSLENFTHDILQLETGHWLGNSESPEGIEPDALIARVLETFEESLRVKSIQLRFAAGGGGPGRIPGAALERIVYNLVSNSIKFCSSPGRLDIISRRRDGFLTIEIEDSGPGLPKSEETLFELARRNIGRGGRGWGLGLASAMDLAEKLEGKLVLIPPKIASGANFLLVLPV